MRLLVQLGAADVNPAKRIYRYFRPAPIPPPFSTENTFTVEATEPWLGAHIGTVTLRNVHAGTKCAGEHCVIHNPSDHHMRDWPLVWRGDKGIMERTCKHGVGHNDPDDAAFLTSTGQGHLTFHGCDGCCQP